MRPDVVEVVPIGDWVLMTFKSGDIRVRHKHSPDNQPITAGRCVNCGAKIDEDTYLKLKLYLKGTMFEWIIPSNAEFYDNS